jgi:hypothetical protein
MLGWACCVHPVAITKSPRWEKGDPASVSWMTADIDLTKNGNALLDCPCWEGRAALASEESHD